MDGPGDSRLERKAWWRFEPQAGAWMPGRRKIVSLGRVGASLLCAGLLPAGCAAGWSYSLDPYSDSYAQLLRAGRDCREAGGVVVAPSAETAGLRGHRCEMPPREHAERRTCLEWRGTFELPDEIGAECVRWKSP